MTSPRRAIGPAGPSTVKVVAAVLALLVLVGGGAWYALGRTGDAGTAGSQPSQSPTPSAPSEAATAPASAPATASATPDTSAARQALQTCRTKVGTQQAVVDEASTGIDHWRRHVQAQTDLFDGRISEEQMKAEFKATKTAGPDDVRRYEAAVAANAAQGAGCETVSGAPAELAGQLEACTRRSDGLGAGLGQADTTMGDWKSHLAAMQRSSTSHVPHAQDIWLEAWKAAPPNLNAWAETQRAIAGAPAC